MRVIFGKAKGKKLKAPSRARPLTDQAKEALFNILREKVAASLFLDLFAGSGAVGIEALSRGAKRAFFVELNRKAVAVIRENLEFTGLKDGAEVYQLDALRAVSLFARRKARFDIIYIGAPYDSPALEKVMEKLGNGSFLHNYGIVVAEHRKQHKLEARYGNLSLFREAKYGETVLGFYSLLES